MGLMPAPIVDRIQYCQDHLPPFTANCLLIGTTAAAVTAMGVKAAAARQAYDDQQAAQNTAKAKTNELHVTLAALTDAMADILKQVKTKAATDGGSVYTLAEIQPPATPSPVSTLGQPYKFKVELGENGALTLKWSCVSPRASAMTYQVWRSVNGGADFTHVGATGNKRFVDATVPAGSASITYKIQAVRSTAAGPWAMFTVRLGVSAGAGAGGGQMTASVVQPKLAA